MESEQDAPAGRTPRPTAPHIRIVDFDTVAGASLPQPPTAFIGREREVAALAALLDLPEVRLVTLTGPGGVGKTRLAIEAAASRPDRWPDGVVFVELASLSDAALVVPTIAQALGIREEGDQPLLARLTTLLRSRKLLLVLDNCEHVLAAAPQIADLLAACRNLTILATSREPLRLAAERQVPVPPLSVPGAGETPDAETSGDSEAVRLFVDRARAVDPGFAPTALHRATITEICRRLDGLPLAVELAAARVGAFPPTTLLDRLERRLPLLTTGPRDAPQRHRTMRDAIAWSYDLLSPDEQAFFRRLAVFAGGFTLEAAEAISSAADGRRRTGDGGFPTPDFRLPTPSVTHHPSSITLDLVASLVDKNLLRVSPGDHGPRFIMLETVREFGLEELERNGELAAIRDLHAAYCLSWAERLAQQIRTSDQIIALDRFEEDHDNARVALDWLLASGETPPSGGGGLGGEVARAAQLVDALHWFWYLRGHRQEGHRRLQAMLALPEEAISPLTRGRLLVAAAMYPIPLQNYYATAQQLYTAGVEAARAAGDQWTVAWGIHQIGWLYQMRGELDEAQVRFQESVRLFQEIGNPWGAALALSSLGLIQALTGDAEGQATLDESLRLAQALGDPWSLARCHDHLGDAARTVADTRRGRAAFTESLRLFRLLGHANASAIILYEIGSLALLDGDLRDAAEYFVEALDLHLAREAWHGVANVLTGLAKTAWRLGRLEEAAQLMAAAQARLDAIALPLWNVDLHEADRLVADLQRALGAPAFAAAWETGSALPPEATITAARDIATATMTTTPAPAIPAEARVGLTPREVDVLRLLTRRLTDREIAETLFISPKTAGKHVSNILSKLGVADRRAAAARAEQLGLG